MCASPEAHGVSNVCHRVAKKMGTYFEMGTDGHRFLFFQIGIS